MPPPAGSKIYLYHDPRRMPGREPYKWAILFSPNEAYMHQFAATLGLGPDDLHVLLGRRYYRMPMSNWNAAVADGAIIVDPKNRKLLRGALKSL